MFNCTFKLTIISMVFSCLGAICFGAVVQAQSQQAESAFRAGVEAFQKNDLKTARASFTQSLKEDPDNATTLYNLGLVESKQGSIGRALALWRKALAQKSGYTAAERAIDWGTARLERQEISHEVETWERVRPSLFQGVPMSVYLALSLMFLAVGGGVLLRYFGERRRALQEDRPVPGLPFIGSTLLLLFMLSTTLATLKSIDDSEVRATIISKKVEARSSPENDSTALFDLFEGLEVIIHNEKGDWVQVTYPGGATGWIPKSAIFSVRDQVSS